MNRARLTALAVACFLFWSLLGLLIGFALTVPIAGLIAGILVATSYWYVANYGAEKFILDLYGAKVLSRTLAHNTYEMVDELSAKAGIEPPILFVMPLQSPNAFILARRERTAAIVLTNGLTQELSREEVCAVLALMISRISQGDAQAWTTAANMTSLPIHVASQAGIRDIAGQRLKIDPNTGMTGLGRTLLSVIMAPSISLLRMAYDPQSLLKIDDFAIRICGDPQAFESALTKIEEALPNTVQGYSGYNPGTVILFAVPPVIPENLISVSAPAYLRAQKKLPGRNPSTDERKQHITVTPREQVPIQSAALN